MQHFTSGSKVTLKGRVGTYTLKLPENDIYDWKVIANEPTVTKLGSTVYPYWHIPASSIDRVLEY